MNAGTVITDAEHTLKPMSRGFRVIPICCTIVYIRLKWRKAFRTPSSSTEVVV